MDKFSLIYRESLNTGVQGDPKEAVTVAYCAGVIDGEGYIGIVLRVHKQHPTWAKGYSPLIRVNMTNPNATDFLFGAFGGRYYYHTFRDDKVRPQYTWEISGRHKVASALQILIPYLRVKKSVAEVTLMFCLSWKNRGKSDVAERQRREQLYFQIKKLIGFRAPATTKREDAETRSDSLSLVETQGEEIEVSPPPTIH